MFPHERSLVKRMANKPFVLLGVNTDKDKNMVKQSNRKEQITWRSWFDGGSTSGPIARLYKVQGYPTLYLIDGKGIIRQKFLGNPGDKRLDELIDKLVKEEDGKKA
jgi:hypothetical protein